MSTASPSSTTWNPLYFLGALGAGGVAVTFFLWLLFHVPHPGRAVPTATDIQSAIAAGGPFARAAIIVALAGIAVAATTHVTLLARHLRYFATWRGTPTWRELRRSNDETRLMAAPLTLAMTLNVGFICGLVFVPGLWSVVEWLFPLAILGFLLIGVWALSIFADFWSRVLNDGGFDCNANNSFAQLMPAFALVMVAVGLAAPAAMSATTATAITALVASSLFLTTALAAGAIKLVLGVRAMLEHGADPESAPTLWLVVPILTVAAITWMRQSHGLAVHVDGGHGSGMLVFLLNAAALQLAFFAVGWLVLGRQRYFARFVFGPEWRSGAYSLVCPLVALAVMGQFLLHEGFVAGDVLIKYGTAYWIAMVPILALQVTAIVVLAALIAKERRHTANGFDDAAAAAASDQREDLRMPLPSRPLGSVGWRHGTISDLPGGAALRPTHSAGDGER
ncbi:MAG: TsoY family (seleno)protein [Alphaproteobacteria bacterium]